MQVEQSAHQHPLEVIEEKASCIHLSSTGNIGVLEQTDDAK